MCQKCFHTVYAPLTLQLLYDSEDLLIVGKQEQDILQEKPQTRAECISYVSLYLAYAYQANNPFLSMEMENHSI